MNNETYELFLRKATEDDRDKLFYWANDEVTRKNSFNSEPIDYETHCEWFSKMMLDDKAVQYILVSHDVNSEIMVDVGQIRVELADDVGRISYSIDKDHRGCGLGRQALNLVKDKIKRDFPNIQKLIGEVKSDNIASMRLFIEENYEEKYRTYEIVL